MKFDRKPIFKELLITAKFLKKCEERNGGSYMSISSTKFAVTQGIGSRTTVVEMFKEFNEKYPKWKIKFNK